MDRLEGVVQPYAWGSRSSIAELVGRATPTDAPEAELWLGAHPKAPSRSERAGRWSSLLSRIEEAPARELGERVVAAFGPRLPFLLKILAAEQPLSLQAHPTASQAASGFDREEAAGIPVDAPHRNYKDRSHKPELLCALTEFDALCGFRAIEESIALLDALAIPALGPIRARLAARDLRSAFEAILSTPAHARQVLVTETIAGCSRIASSRSPFAEACAWAIRLAELHPGDVGVATALLLNHVRLSPGEAIFLPAGNLHAYLGGVGVEIMASSDNVLRGGLTPKHVDVPELSRILDFAAGPVPIVRAQEVDGEDRWPTEAEEFLLSRPRARPFAMRVSGPEILLCTEGEVVAKSDAGDLVLRKGQAAFVPASSGGYAIDGAGTVYRASVPGSRRQTGSP